MIIIPHQYYTSDVEPYTIDCGFQFTTPLTPLSFGRYIPQEFYADYTDYADIPLSIEDCENPDGSGDEEIDIQTEELDNFLNGFKVNNEEKLLET